MDKKIDYNLILSILRSDTLNICYGNPISRGQIFQFMEDYGVRRKPIVEVIKGLNPSCIINDSGKTFLLYPTDIVASRLENWVEQMIEKVRPVKGGQRAYRNRTYP